MPKLIKSVSDSDENNQSNESKNTKLSFTKKISTNSEQKITGESTQISTTVVTNKTTKVVSKVTSVNEISDWLINFIGKDIFDQIKENPYLQLPYTDDDININKWLEKALKTIFTKESIAKISEHIQKNIDSIAALETEKNTAVEEKETMQAKLGKLKDKFEQMQDQIDDAESDKYKIKKQLMKSVTLESLINEVFVDDEKNNSEMKRLIEMLNESLENINDELSLFIVRFSKGWIYLKSSFSLTGEDEKQNLETIHNALTVLLKNISGVYIPERRPLLDIVGDYVSSKFKTYDFVSPERTLQVDPDIHNTEGKGSSTVKEGISFAVVRKETKKAVKYADIVC